MKYTIELTDNQKGQMDLLIEMAHKHVGFTPKLEMETPIPMTESPAYKKGFEDGKLWAINENAKDHQGYYDNGYNKGIEDLSHAMEVYYPLNSKERLDYFGTNVQVETYAVTNPKSLIVATKAYEEKKNTIECGDEVTILKSGITGIVLAIKGGEYEILSSDAKWNRLLEDQIKKTGRNLKAEVKQLLDKLKGEKNNE